MTTTGTHQTEITADPDVPLVPDHPGLRCPAREGLPGPHRPRARGPMARATPPRDADRPLRLPHRRVNTATGW